MGIEVKVENGGADGEIGGVVSTMAEDVKPVRKQQEQGSKGRVGSDNKYWMRDPYSRGGYSSYPRGYGGASGLYNLAWAQAVQNKPLNEVLVELNDNNKKDEEESNKSEKQEECGGDSEKEEGELEEGEIDGETESDEKKKGGGGGGDEKVEYMRVSGLEMEDVELEIQVSSIRKVLDNVTPSQALKSFDIVCARLRSSLESLRELVLHTWFPSKDDLIHQAFSAILSLFSVFSEMTPALKDQNRDKFSRLLTFVRTLSSVLFTPDQGNKVEDMCTSVCPPPPALPKPKPRERQEELVVTEKPILTDSNTLSLNVPDNSSDYSKIVGLDSTNAHNVDKQNNNILSDAMKQFQSNFKTRAGFNPLLDLHKVHDEDSLPSPTSKTTPPSPFFGAAAPAQISLPVHPYQTEAMKAVSSYQQKFGRTTYFSQDRLPSPTPSEDGNGGAADDSHEEVSSFPACSNVRMTNTSASMQPFISSAASLTTQAPTAGMSAAPLSLVSNPASRAPVKSRDPRLRHLHSNSGSMDLSSGPSLPVSSSASNLESLGDLINLKKNKASDHPVVDSSALKRQKNGLETEGQAMNANVALSGPRTFGLESSTVAGLQAVTRGPVGPPTDPRKAGGVTVSPVTISPSPSVSMSTISSSLVNGSTTESLQSLLKGIAGNPAAWVSMFKEQQRLSEPLPTVPQPGNINSVAGQVKLPTTAPVVHSGVASTPVAMLQAPSQTALTSPQDSTAKLRMKPRDPRRVLQTNAAQKTGTSAADLAKANGKYNVSNPGVLDSLSMQRNINASNVNSASSPATVLPDIANQFTKSLKNIAEIVSAPQTSSAQPSSISPQPMQVDLGREIVNSGGPDNTNDQLAATKLRPEEVVAGRSQSPNHWGDVEHLFEGFDDQQRAAIQQERARRIDEQKTMFAARKLCLVLDLDHTLLNSAKFSEVEPIHDEKLRMKEEQDRERPQRHLFRFPHMGMWTKLRSGIWNFLEKASKLYELHLYTMGNKLYATEMAKVLDPTGTLFAGRVISRGDDGDLIDGDERVPKSKDLDGVLGMESSVVIIDDSVRVWPHNKLNLIVVERYTYFPCSRRQFGLPGPSLLEIDHDERPEEGTLASTLAVIERIHQKFFAHECLDDVDVRNILAAEQRRILAGCRILFSRVFPVGEANPHLHPLWQTAEQFGAVCTNQIDEQVTHVVANSLGTDKVNWGLSTGRFVVHPNWVEASALLYRRANEADFAIKS